MGTALDTANRFYDSTHNRKGEGVADLVAEDMTFHGPLQEVSGAEAYLAMLADFLPFFRGSRMLAQVEQGDVVCSMFELDMSSPKGEQFTLSICDWLHVKQDRIARSDLFFDPRPVVAAFEMEAAGRS